MDFVEALKILRAFSACRLRVYRKFFGFPEYSSQEAEGEYVVFADGFLVEESCYCDLRDFAQAHNLNITPFGQYLMVSSR